MRSQAYTPSFDLSGSEKSVGDGPDHGLMQYELLLTGAFGAVFQGATCIQGLKGIRNGIWKGTEVCHLIATDLHEPVFEWNRFPQGWVPTGIENQFWLEEFNGTVAETSFRDSRLHLNLFAGVSTMFLCALCTAFGRTCPLIHSLLWRRPLRGSDQRSKLIQWVLLGFVLLVAIQVVTCQILVSGGVHIQPDYLSVAIRVQAELAFLLLFVRLGLKWRCDSIGPCRSVCNSRKCAVRPKPHSVKLKALLICLNIASSHATQVFHACEQGAMSIGNRSSFQAASDSDGQYHRDNSVLRDSLQSIQQCPDSSRASFWGPIEQRTDLGQHCIDALSSHAAEGSALPEATFCEYETSPFSWPCEGDSRPIVPEGTEEGHSHSSMNGPGQESNIESSDSALLDDDRLTFLGNFVIDPRTQEPLGTDVEQDRSVRREEAENLVFQDRPFLAKTWFAPLNRCNSQPRDLVVSVEDFGRIGDVVCSAWGDYLTVSSCSFRLVWPQPALFTYQESWHFLVFDGQGPPAVLVHNTCGSKGEQNPCHSFCACAFDHRHKVRRSQGESSGIRWKHGNLVRIFVKGARSVCESFPLLHSSGTDGDNTATPGRFRDDINPHDGNSLMQQQLMHLANIQAVTITAMRFARAVDHQIPMYEIANFATQNFVKKDGLRSWIRNVLGHEGDSMILATWRVSSTAPITHECDRVLLEGPNWARSFRLYWKKDDSFKTPVIISVDPQPPVVSGGEMKQFHVIAVENRVLKQDYVVHLFDIWEAESPTDGTGWHFLGRKALVILRTSTVEEVAKIMDMPRYRSDAQVHALYSQRDGETKVTFRRDQRLAVPDCSYVHLVFVNAKENCLPISVDVSSEGNELLQTPVNLQQHAKYGENTATPVDDGQDELVMMQAQQVTRTAAEQALANCYEPIFTPVRLYSGRESSWRLWNHFVRSRLWRNPRFDEMSAWVLPEGTWTQTIPVTLFSSRPGSQAWNDPLRLWHALGGQTDPIVLMVFPAVNQLSLPEDHLLFVPADTYEHEERVFLVDVVDRSEPGSHVVERVAVRGTGWTPRSLARSLGHTCTQCIVLCRGCNRSAVFVVDQFIQFHTGSFLVLDVSAETTQQEACRNTDVPAAQLSLQNQGGRSLLEPDETALFHFQPPPPENAHVDAEAYFWVRKTIVYQPALLKAAMEAGLLVAQHWPLLIVHFEETPHWSRTFGFERHHSVTTDQIRIRFRALFADLFATQEEVSVGPVGLEGIQNPGRALHEISFVAFRGRITLDVRTALLCITMSPSVGYVTSRAVRLPREVTRSLVVAKAELTSSCRQGQNSCVVTTEAGVTIRDQPVRLSGWQRIFITVTEEMDDIPGCSLRPTGADQAGDVALDVTSLMQTEPIRFRPYDALTLYVFAGEDPFFGDTVEGYTTVETYRHLWQDRDGPARENIPVIVYKSNSVALQIEAAWRSRMQDPYVRMVPVRPIPDFGLGPQPTVLILDRDSEQVMPVLFDYTSDDRVFMGTGLVDCSQGFPQVNALFDLLIPDNDCRAGTSCIVRANGRHYVPGQVVMLYEGILVRLDEQDLEQTTTEEATSTDYDPGASAVTTSGISSNASLKPEGPPSEPDWTDPEILPLTMTTGPFFDLNSEGELTVADQEVDPDTALQWFSAIAVQRTQFLQYDRMLAEFREGSLRDEWHNAVFVIVGSDWNDAVYMTHLPNDAEHLMVFGQMRFALFDEFPVHVPLTMWIVHPNLRPEEQNGFRDRYILVDYDCPDTERAVSVIIADPEDSELERLAIRVRPQMTNLLLYIQVGKTVKCTSKEFECVSEHNGHALPEGSYWPTFHGMKLRVNIREVPLRRQGVCVEQDTDRSLFGLLRSDMHDDMGGDEQSLIHVAFVSPEVDTPATTSSGQVLSDTEEQSFMQFFTETDMQTIEVEPHVPVMFAQSYMGVILIDPGQKAGDILRTYLHDRKGTVDRDFFTVHVWMLSPPEVNVAHTAQRCACVRAQSYTDALLRLWTVSFPSQPLAVTLVHPDLQPLSLRAVPVDLIVVPDSCITSGKRVFLVDVVGMPLPRRLAVLADGPVTVKDIAALAGARLICELPTTHCSLHSAAPQDQRVWEYDQTVTAAHGSGLVLWIEPVDVRRAIYMPVCSDEITMMQLTDGEAITPLRAYMLNAVAVGFMNLWVHDNRHPYIVQYNHRRVNLPRPQSQLELTRSNWLHIEGENRWTHVFISPFPVLEGMHQPTIIHYRETDNEHWLILVQAKKGADRSIGTIDLLAELRPCAVGHIFDMMIPDHRCETDSTCVASLDGDFYRFWVDLPLYSGAFLEIVEVEAEQENTTTCSEGDELSEEEIFTDDETTYLTQLEIRLFRFIRCPDSGRPISTSLREQGIDDMEIHWQKFEDEVFGITSWHRTRELQMELAAMAPIEARGTKVILFWFGNDELPTRRMDTGWSDSWSQQTGLGTARAELRLLLWDHVPPGIPYTFGTASPQPTTRQQHGRDDLYIIGQPDQDMEMAILLVTNFVQEQEDRYLIRAVRTQALTSREQILRDVAMTGMCQIVECLVSADGVIWNPEEQHHVHTGQRVDLEAKLDKTINVCREGSEQAEEEVLTESDSEISMEDNQNDIQHVYRSIGGNTATPDTNQSQQGTHEEDRGKNSSLQDTETGKEVSTDAEHEETGLFETTDASTAHSVIPVRDQAYMTSSRENTATRTMSNRWSEDFEEVFLMQNEERLYMDDGTSFGSPDRLQRCVQEDLAWVEPLRLRPDEMQKSWEFPGVDYLKYHFSRHGLVSASFRIEGWLFKDYNQNEGSGFAWGISAGRPWHEQVSHLLKGSGLKEGLSFTVIPQPEDFALDSGEPATMQLIAPFRFEMPPVLPLVVEYAIDAPMNRRAVICQKPCTAFSVFHLIGLHAWCGVDHHCGVFFRHGLCSMYFQDVEILRVPAASRVVLSVTNRYSRRCMQQDPRNHVHRTAIQIANRLHLPGTPDHHLAFKRAREVLLSQPLESETDVDVASMVQSLSISEEPSDEVSHMQRPFGPAPSVRTDSSHSTDPTHNSVPAGSEAVSSLSSQPPPMGGQLNREYDWLPSWQRVRRHLTDYSTATGRRMMAGDLCMHLIVCRQGMTSHHGLACPERFLTADCPIDHLIRYIQHFAFPFDLRCTRAFPLTVEIYQNIPSAIVIDVLPPDRRPLIAQVTREGQVALFVYLAAPIERVASILRWLNRQIIILTPFETFLNRQRVQGQDDVPLYAGDVLRILVRTRRELHWPVNSTEEPVESLQFSSHNTWTLDPSLEPGGDNNQGTVSQDSEQEHTLQQVLGDNRLRNMPSSSAGAGIEDTEETSFLQSTGVITLLTSVVARYDTPDQPMSEFAAQVQELSWFPEQDQDWIGTVVRRSMTAQMWDFGEHVHVLRPFEPLVRVQLEVRASWDHPSVFDLAGLLWTVWPDLNYIRFRLVEVTSTFQVGQYPGLVTLLVRPHRWGQGADTQIINVEVVRVQWQSLISKQTAHLTQPILTPRQLVEQIQVRDCTAHICEARVDGEPVWPDQSIQLRNGALVTILVRQPAPRYGGFQIAVIRAEHRWDGRRWMSQEQPFSRDGIVWILRTAQNEHGAHARVRVPVESWHTWEIVYHKIRRHWISFRYSQMVRHIVHDTRQQIPEFRSQVTVAIITNDELAAETRCIVVVCRKEAHISARFWAQHWRGPINEIDAMDLCGYTELCQDPSYDCEAAFNARSLRFVQHMTVAHGDIVVTEVRSRVPFCSARYTVPFGYPDHDRDHMQMLQTRTGRCISGKVGSKVDGERLGDHTLTLLQVRVHSFRTSDSLSSMKNWNRSSTEGLRPPGNPTYWFVSQVNTMSRYVEKDQDIFVIDDVLRPATKLSLANCLNLALDERPVPTPARSRAKCPDVSTRCVSIIDRDVQEDLMFADADRPCWKPQVLDLPEHFRSAVLGLRVCEWNEDLYYADAFEIYSDGSFDGKQAGWAIVLVAHWQENHALVGTCSGAISAGPNTEVGVEIPKLSAQVAEQAALIWGHWWMLRFARTYGWQGQVYFRWDSIVPGKQALGDYGTQTQLSRLLRALAIGLEQQQGEIHVYHAHVRAHQGVLLNEIADAAAKLARVEEPASPDSGKLAHLTASLSDVGHIWWFFCNHQSQRQLPVFSKNTGVFQWSTRTQPAKLHQQVQDSLTFGGRKEVGQFLQCQFRFASYNVLSLLDPQPPPMNKETGRAKLLRDQVQNQGLHIVGLQECRSTQGTVHSDTHMRLCSGAETNGTLGVELWVSKKVPVQGHKCLHVRDFAVLHADSRCLLVRYDGDFGAFIIVVAHAPHAGHPAQERKAWWEQLTQLVRAHRKSLQVIAMIDANATWAGPANEQLGDLCEVTPNNNTPMFVDFVAQLELFAPSTSPDYQTGPWFTWTHARTGKEHRIDYVLFPNSWAGSWIQTWTDPSVTVGHAGVDHIATVAEVYWEQSSFKVKKKTRYDRDAIMHPDNRHIVFDILDRCPQPEWGVNASDHAVLVSQYLQGELEDAFPAPKANIPQYTTNETRKIHQELVSAKRAVTQMRLIARFRTLALFFRAWGKKELREESAKWTYQFNCRWAQTTQKIRHLADSLRVRLRKDRSEFLEALASEVNDCPPGEMFKKLRPILKPSKKQSQVVQPLPKLVGIDGEMILSRALQEKRWTEHFASIEAGHVVDARQFVRQQLQRQTDRCKPSSFSSEDVPTLTMIERAIRSANRDRATEPDGIPAEIFKAIPGKAAKLLYPLALKLALRVEEPASWKGGYLFPLYKGKGAMCECANHRGILLMDVMGKLTRSGLREWINSPYLCNGHPMQLGGRPHQQAQFGAQLTRSFLRWRKACNSSAAVLFVDIASAFYKALREVATGADVSDQDIAKVAQRLGIGPEVMPALHEALHGRSAYATLTSSVARQQVLQESLSGTWFSVDGSTIVATEQGTRPGDSWADVVFNVLLSQVLRKTQKILGEESLTTPVTGFERCVCPQPIPETQVSLLQVTWADDIAMMVSLREPASVWTDLPRVTQVLVDELHAIGMAISCGVAKTAALVLLRGAGSVAVRRKFVSAPTSRIAYCCRETRFTFTISATLQTPWRNPVFSWKPRTGDCCSLRQSETSILESSKNHFSSGLHFQVH